MLVFDLPSRASNACRVEPCPFQGFWNRDLVANPPQLLTHPGFVVCDLTSSKLYYIRFPRSHFPFLSRHTPLQRRVYFLVLVPPSTGSPPGYPVIMQFKPALALVYLKRVSPHGKRARPPNRLSTHGVPSTPDLLWTSCRPCVLQVYVYIIEEESREELVLFVLSKLPFNHSYIRSFVRPFTRITLLPFSNTQQPDSRPVEHHLPNNALHKRHHHPSSGGHHSLRRSHSSPKRQPRLPRPPRRVRQIDFLRRQRPGRHLLVLDLQAASGPVRHSVQRAGLGQRGQLRRLCKGVACREIHHCHGKSFRENLT